MLSPFIIGRALRPVCKKFRDSLPAAMSFSNMYFDKSFKYFYNLDDFFASGDLNVEKLFFQHFDGSHEVLIQAPAVKTVFTNFGSIWNPFEWTLSFQCFPGLENFNGLRKQFFAHVRPFETNNWQECKEIQFLYIDDNPFVENDENDEKNVEDAYNSIRELHQNTITHLAQFASSFRNFGMFPNLVGLCVGNYCIENDNDLFDYSVLSQASSLRILYAGADPRNISEFLSYVRSSQLEKLVIFFPMDRSKKENRLEQRISSKTLEYLSIDWKPIFRQTLGNRCPRIPMEEENDFE